jgi:hypothetical protein
MRKGSGANRLAKAKKSGQTVRKIAFTPDQVDGARGKTNIVRANGQIKFRVKRRSEGAVAQGENLRDEDWRKIAASSPLPADARIQIAAAIGIYRDLVSAEKTDSGTKALVRQMRGRIAKLAGEIAKLSKDPVFFRAGLPMWSTRTGPVPADLEKLIEEVMVLDQILADGQDRMAMKAGRKSSSSLEFLIDMLDEVQARETKRFVKRSIKNGTQLRPSNEFIRLCVGVADPKISASSIENALTKCIARNRRSFET